MMASVQMAAPEWHLHLVTSDDGPLVSRAAKIGVPTIILPFPERLSRLGDAGAGGPAGKQVRRLAVLRELSLVVPSVMTYIRRLRRTLHELAPDVIHTNGFKMHVLGVRARPLRVPIIWHIHDYVSARPIMARLLSRHAARCAVAIANSRSVADDVRKVCGESLTVQTIYNGIDVENFSPDGPTLDLDALSGLPPAAPGTVKVGMLATLARWKGHETFLQALAMLPTDLPVRGYIASGALYKTVGSQHSLAELKSIAAKLGVSGRVGFTGFVNDPASAMRSLDIIVHASTQPEPFGLVIAEGMACGRAVIVSQTGGAAEISDTDINVLGHPPGDAARLAERITHLVANKDLRTRISTEARAAAEQRFNRERLARELIPIYREVLSTNN